MAHTSYIELAERLNDQLWARRGNDNGGKIYPWVNSYDERLHGVQIACCGKIEETATNISGRKMAKAVRDAYKTICERIGLEPELPKRTDYCFRASYGEWHFIDGNGKLLLVWVDPLDNLCTEYDEEDKPVKEPTYDEVLAECEDYIETGNIYFEFAEDEEDEREGYHGVRREAWERLPENAAEIMARTLYQSYYA